MGEKRKFWLPLPISREIPRGISREIGRGSQRPGEFPGKRRGCASNFPGNFPGNCAASDFPGNWLRSRGISRGICRMLDFPGNFPGNWLRSDSFPGKFPGRAANCAGNPPWNFLGNIPRGIPHIPRIAAKKVGAGGGGPNGRFPPFWIRVRASNGGRSPWEPLMFATLRAGLVTSVIAG